MNNDTYAQIAFSVLNRCMNLPENGKQNTFWGLDWGQVGVRIRGIKWGGMGWSERVLEEMTGIWGLGG